MAENDKLNGDVSANAQFKKRLVKIRQKISVEFDVNVFWKSALIKICL